LPVPARLTIANRPAAQLVGARITLLDARKEHYYQSGYTLVAGGFKPVGYPVSSNRTTSVSSANRRILAQMGYSCESKVIVNMLLGLGDDTIPGRHHQSPALCDSRAPTGRRVPIAAGHGVSADDA
jgi:hypothetical protein